MFCCWFYIITKKSHHFFISRCFLWVFFLKVWENLVCCKWWPWKFFVIEIFCFFKFLPQFFFRSNKELTNHISNLICFFWMLLDPSVLGWTVFCFMMVKFRFNFFYVNFWRSWIILLWFWRLVFEDLRVLHFTFTDNFWLYFYFCWQKTETKTLWGVQGLAPLILDFSYGMGLKLCLEPWENTIVSMLWL